MMQMAVRLAINMIIKLLSLMETIKIFPSQAALLLGVTERTARANLNKIKQYLGKKKYQIITLDEFCAYYGIDDSDRAREEINKLL